ncbi:MULTISPECIES: hypothetical protein [unclassified Microbacterium]|uniref:hypothetical protein n=1 Tax=unclassified Microbacterium TaxID=2609290 RepID=UPI00214AF5F1|nr:MULTISPECIES: hypothetical protein [unclassified Microbacterium]MCR2810603.1 hypothetical protein [Microbacterium sp. zg.B185]WIM18140.1 hypothetical protein QNO12_11050 [Microbacterium sp. zg-B185]
MADTDHIGLLETPIGGLSRAELRSELSARGILLNAHAETLLADAAFDQQPRRVIAVTERTVAALGRPEGAHLSEIFALAREGGLLLCPPDAGPYLRLALTDQDTSPDSVMSAGNAPTGSLTVAAEPLRADDEFPKGFYLRVVDGRPWLRGYRCDDAHTWSAEDRFLFRVPA